MVRESMKNYLALASGLTELTRERAVSAAEALVAQGEAAKDQVTALAEELLVSSKSNREAIAVLVRTEVDRTVTRLGVVSTDDVSTLFRHVENALRETAAKAADAVHELAVGMGLTEQSAPATPSPRPKVSAVASAGVSAKQAARKTASKSAAKPGSATSKAAKQSRPAAAKAAKAVKPGKASTGRKPVSAPSATSAAPVRAAKATKSAAAKTTASKSTKATKAARTATKRGS